VCRGGPASRFSTPDRPASTWSDVDCCGEEMFARATHRFGSATTRSLNWNATSSNSRHRFLAPT
jgi:hypothetical protein